MRFFTVMLQVAFLYVFSLAGSMISKFLHLPLPGSLVGMALLFVMLSAGIIREQYVSEGCRFLLRYLPLFFIPITVGVIKYPFLLSLSGLKIAAVIFVSTAIMISFSGLIVLIFRKESSQNG
ncbi:CidA/LrgA family protein [Fictibacillus aquaticus]|nr:CidA/LrgA family protein [Fictibacillus aquaticus]